MAPRAKRKKSKAASSKPEPSHKVGRPSKLDAKTRKKILKHLRAGNFRGAAAEAAGIGSRTLETWMKTGRDEPDSEFGEFRRAVLAAERSAETSVVGFLFNAVKKGDVRAITYWLDRKTKFGKPKVQKLEHTGDPTKPIGVETVNAMSEEEVLGYLERIEENQRKALERAAAEKVEAEKLAAAEAAAAAEAEAAKKAEQPDGEEPELEPGT